MRMSVFSSAFVIFIAAACFAGQPAVAGDLEDLVTLMTGSFSSASQAAEDPDNFWDIRLEMAPIWTDRTDGFWLYVEQASAEKLDKPYRQRVYHVMQVEDNLFASAVYSVPDPEAVIGAWKVKDPLSQWSPDDLKVREGCTVYLARDEDGSFSGSTRDKECTSTLRGASYATSEIVISTEGVASWDRGYDADVRQVWGAVKAGYVFLRTAPEKP